MRQAREKHADKGEFEMALISCPECSKEVSDQAWTCPQCGFLMMGGGTRIDEHGTNQDRVNIADRTAIIVAGVAIGVSLFSTPGPYGPMSILIGLALIATLHAADSYEDRNRFQSASFALAWALSFLLIAGLFLINPYIHPDKGAPDNDHFKSIEFTFIHMQWIEQTFKDQASELVSFCMVGVVATLWYLLRRRFFTVHQPLLPPISSVLTPTNPPLPPASPSIPAEERPEHPVMYQSYCPMD
jgi:hypothetical protein